MDTTQQTEEESEFTAGNVEEEMPTIDAADVDEIIELPDEPPPGDLSDNEDTEMESGMDTEETTQDDAVLTLDQHSDSVYAVAVFSAGGLVLTGGGDDRAILYQLGPAPLPPPPGAPAAAAAAPPAVTLTGARELGGHGDSVTAVGFSADGSLAATAGYDGTVRVWNTATAELVQTLEGPGEIDWVAWHPRGNALLAGAQDATMWMWLASTGAVMQVFAGHQGPVTCGLFPGPGKAVASGSADGTVRLWAPRTGHCRHTFAGHGFHEAPINCMADNKDGTMLLTGAQDGNIGLLNIQTPRIIALIAHNPTPEAIANTLAEENEEQICHSVESVGFCNTSPWIASGASDKTLRIWDISGASPRLRHVCQHGGSVIKLFWHPMKPLIFTGCTDGMLRAWDGPSGSCLQTFSGHKDMVLDMAVLYDEKMNALLVSASDDHTTKCFDVTNHDDEGTHSLPA